MTGEGFTNVESQREAPFHERYKNLLILCSLAGLKIHAVDRVITTRWKRQCLRAWNIVVHMILTSVTMNSFLHLLFGKKADALEGVHDLLVIGCSTHSTLRQFYMHKHIDKFDELYTAWDNLFGSDNDWKSRQESVDKHNRGAKNTIGALGIGTTLMLTIFSISNFFASDKIFQFPSIIPYRQQSPDYEILVSYYSIEVFFFCIAVASSQMLLMTPIIWELGELNRLKGKLSEIFRDGETVIEHGENIKAKTYTNRGITTVGLEMTVWLEQHQKLCKFHKMSMSLNNFELGMEMIATFTEACSMAILLSSDHYAGDPVHQFSILLAFSGYFALFYYSCAKCNELSEMSVTVADDAFAENWASLPTKLKKNFLMIITRTMKPLNYYGAYVFRIDIATFKQIFQTAYSVFNFYFTIAQQ